MGTRKNMNDRDMKIGVLGSGDVGKVLASGFIADGNKTMIGTNHADKLSDWLNKSGGCEIGDFEKAASFGDLLILAVRGTEVESVIKSARPENFDGKVVIDTTNPLLFGAEGELPKLSIGYPHSNGEIIQDALPGSKVVKAFNTMPAALMTSAKLQEGTPDMLIAGDDSGAKSIVTDIASGWGWPVIDLGDIKQSYLLEALGMIVIQYGFQNNNWTHAFKLLKK